MDKKITPRSNQFRTNVLHNMHSGNSSSINSHCLSSLPAGRSDDAIMSPLGTTNYRMLREIRRQVLPVKLNAILSNPEFSHIVTWMPHGRAWRILSPHEFAEKVLPLYVEQPNYNSFIRLVNAWGFHRITSGSDTNAYFHKLFLRGKPHLHRMMKRLGRNAKKPRLDQRDEPDFYSMAPLTDDDNNPSVPGSSYREVEDSIQDSIQGVGNASRHFRPQDLLGNHMTTSTPLSTRHQTLSTPFNPLPSMDSKFCSVHDIALASKMNLLNPPTLGANIGTDPVNASGDTAALIAALNNLNQVVSAPMAGTATTSNPSARTMLSNMTNLQPPSYTATPLSMSADGTMDGNFDRDQSIIEALCANARRGDSINISTLSNDHRRQRDLANFLPSRPPTLLPQSDTMGGGVHDIVSRIVAQSDAARPEASLPSATNQMSLDPNTLLLLQQYSALTSAGRSNGNNYSDTDSAVNQLVRQIKLQQEQLRLEETRRNTTALGCGGKSHSSSVGSDPSANAFNELFLRQINHQLVNYEDQHNRMQQNVLNLQQQNSSLLSERLKNLSEYQEMIALNNHLLEQNIKKLQDAGAGNKASQSPARSKSDLPGSSSFRNSVKSASLQHSTAPVAVTSKTQVPRSQSQAIQQECKQARQRTEEVCSGALNNMNVQEILLSLKRQRK